MAHLSAVHLRDVFEEEISRCLAHEISVWINYAHWEESRREFDLARSVWESAIATLTHVADSYYQNHPTLKKVCIQNLATLWLQYAKAAMKNKLIEDPRYVWDSAIKSLPEVDELWYGYIHMEEKVAGRVYIARQIYDQWMNMVNPNEQAWLSYFQFEIRNNATVDRARKVLRMFALYNPTVKNWFRLVEFEMKNGDVYSVRRCYKLAVRSVPLAKDEEDTKRLLVAFAEFEEFCNEIELARCIYEFAINHIQGTRVDDLYCKFAEFEKRYGQRDRDGMYGDYSTVPGDQETVVMQNNNIPCGSSEEKMVHWDKPPVFDRYPDDKESVLIEFSDKVISCVEI